MGRKARHRPSGAARAIFRSAAYRRNRQARKIASNKASRSMATLNAPSGAEAVALVFQKPSLHRKRIAFGHAHESAERAMRADDAVARDDDGDVVGAARAADRARRGVQQARELAVRARLADRDAGERVPDAAAERRSLRPRSECESDAADRRGSARSRASRARQSLSVGAWARSVSGRNSIPVTASREVRMPSTAKGVRIFAA